MALQIILHRGERPQLQALPREPMMQVALSEVMNAYFSIGLCSINRWKSSNLCNQSIEIDSFILHQD